MTPRPRVRGFSLLFVVTMVAVLSFGATLLLRQVQDVGVLVGARQRQTRSEQAARAALVVGTRLLNDALFAFADAPMDLTKVRALPTLASNDLLCSDGVDCRQWRQLSAGLDVGTEGARARLAFTCNPGGCGTPEDEVLNFQIRALSTLQNGSGQLVEVFVEADRD